jgi:pimeloyl-ACP methyl ester carboxylesterase
MFKHIIFIVACLSIAGKSMAQHTYGSFYTHDAYINYILSEYKTKKSAIVMVPGANLSSYIYVTTPDGRKGWSELFADKGYDVYMVNDPRYDFKTGGFVGPYTVPADGPEATPGSQQGWQNDIWRRWGFGPSQGNPYPDALFPTDYFNVFAQNYPYIGASNESYSDAIQAVIDSTESEVWLIAHSAGAGRAVTAARQKKKQVNGLILIEPAGPPDADDFPDLDGLHMFGVYGDYIASRNQTNRKLATEAAAILFQNAGGVADVVSLPEDSLIHGNSHLLMQDRNSEKVFGIIEQWLRQFSTNTVTHERILDKKTSINLYPNPAGYQVWIEDKITNGHEYCIYSSDGRIVKESTVIDQIIDLSDAPNGLLFVRIRYKEQYIVKKIIKNGL